MPRAVAAPVETSAIRSAEDEIRALTVAMTSFPFSVFVTLTWVPIGKEGWAIWLLGEFISAVPGPLWVKFRWANTKNGTVKSSAKTVSLFIYIHFLMFYPVLLLSFIRLKKPSL
jgi:threonine/homoserine efflux transporter RhtA